MSLIRLLKEKKTPEEIEPIRKIRQGYYSYITGATANIINAVKANTLTPETSSQISTLLSKDRAWLDSNPDIDVNDLSVRYDSLLNNVQNSILTDKPKITFRNTLLLYKSLFSENLQKEIITKEQYDKLERVLNAEDEWYKKNVLTATELDFINETQKMNDAIKEGGIKAEEVTTAGKDANKSTEAVKKQLTEKELEEETRQALTMNIKKGASIIGWTALRVFLALLLVVLCTLSGSFLANLSIGRPPQYRILYFIYGLLPQLMPFVLAYTIYVRIVKGPISMYAILPVSIEPATTRFGKYLWYPFYYVPDQDAINLYTEFQKALPAMVVPAIPT